MITYEFHDGESVSRLQMPRTGRASLTRSTCCRQTLAQVMRAGQRNVVACFKQSEIKHGLVLEQAEGGRQVADLASARCSSVWPNW